MMHEVCPVLASAPRFCEKRLPCVVLELDSRASAAPLQCLSQQLQAFETFTISFFAEVLEVAEGATAGAVHATIDAFDVIVLAHADAIDKGVGRSAHRTLLWTNREVGCRHYPLRDTKWGVRVAFDDYLQNADRASAGVKEGGLARWRGRQGSNL